MPDKLKIESDIIIKHGLEADLPLLKEAELAFTKDTKKVFIGTEHGNKEITGSSGSGGTGKVDDVTYKGETLVVDKIALLDMFANKVDNLSNYYDKEYVDNLIASLIDGTIIDGGIFGEEIEDIIDGGQF